MDHNTDDRSDEDVKIRVPTSGIRLSNNFDSKSLLKLAIIFVFVKFVHSVLLI